MLAPISKSAHSRLWVWNKIIANSYYHRSYGMYNHFFPWCFIPRTNSVIFTNFLLLNIMTINFVEKYMYPGV